MLDVLPKLIVEMREDAAVAAIVGANPTVATPRVRGFEPKSDDVQPSDRWRAFVVIVQLDVPRDRRVPVQRPSYAFRCYGRTLEEARDLYMACSDALHDVGPRVHANGLGIYISADVSGGTPDIDPDTRQPLYEFTAQLIATTQAVAS
jgi:hypothetical protein